MIAALGQEVAATGCAVSLATGDAIRHSGGDWLFWAAAACIGLLIWRTGRAREARP